MRIKDVMMWQENENFKEEDLNRFMSRVSLKAMKFQEGKLIGCNEDVVSAVDMKFTCRTTHYHQRYQSMVRSRQESPKLFFERGGGEEKSSVGEKWKLETSDLQESLNLISSAKGEVHFIQHCELFNNATREAPRKEQRAAKRSALGEKKKEIKKLTTYTRAVTPHSVQCFEYWNWSESWKASRSSFWCQYYSTQILEGNIRAAGHYGIRVNQAACRISRHYRSYLCHLQLERNAHCILENEAQIQPHSQKYHMVHSRWRIGVWHYRAESVSIYRQWQQINVANRPWSESRGN